MNWLAHAFLSSADADFRVGNMLADMIKGRALDGQPEGFLAGVRCHRAIDRFTDSHLVWRRSRERLNAWRRFSGILTDVVYDHFLASNWVLYSGVPLKDFTQAVYAEALARQSLPPEHARRVAAGMAQGDYLGAYVRMEAVAATLKRISRRLAARTGREVALEKAMPSLEANYTELGEDFAGFFPQVLDHVQSYFPGAGRLGETAPGGMTGFAIACAACDSGAESP